MKLEREKNAKRNLVAGIIQRILSLVLPFFLRTAIIYSIGMAYVGINSLFGSVLNVLSLAELGFGSAIVYSMYEPIAQNDHTKIRALLNYYKKCYHAIGLIILGAGLALTPAVPLLVKSDVPAGINLYIVYIISLLSTVIGYFVFAHKSSLLVALQRNDITSWVSTAITVVKDGLQIAVILFLKDYYLFLLLNPVMNVASGIAIEIITKRKYPEFTAAGTIDKEAEEGIKRKVKSLFIYKIGYVVSNSVDNIVISAFLGLTVVAIYGNYYYIMTALFGFLAIYYDSIRAGIGNKMALESKSSVYELYQELLFFQGIMIGWMTICLVCLYQDFMMVWIRDEASLLDGKMIILLGLYFYSWKINDIVTIFKEAAGMWEYDRFRPLLSSLCNLVINILLVQVIGLYGVVLSTIVCELTFSMCWSVQVLYKHYFHRSYSEYLIEIAKHTAVSLAAGLFTFYLCSLIQVDSRWASLGIKLVLCCTIPTLLYFLIYRKNELFRKNIQRIFRMVH